MSFGASGRRRAFTLTEILIVIGIIVLLIALAVPAFSLITGGKSIEGATNQLSAALGRARAEAIGLQKPTGILFFIEPRSNRVNMAIVTVVGEFSHPNNGERAYWLDLTSEADFIPLPIGVSAQTICDATFAGTVRNGDGYIGYNRVGTTPSGGSNNVGAGTPTVPLPGARYGGVILFDGSGRLISSAYGFKCVNTAGQQSRIGGLLKPEAGLEDMVPGPQVLGAPPAVRSQFGLVMFERDPFATQAGSVDQNIDARLDNSTGPYGVPTSAGTEAAEEKWLDENSTPILINRYTGTLVKGE